MSRIRLYLDEDAMDGDLLRGLRSGLDVVSAAAMGMIQREDEDHLALAAAQGRSLYSFYIADFHEIHAKWTAASGIHAGIILAQQKRYEAMESREEFLGRW